MRLVLRFIVFAVFISSILVAGARLAGGRNPLFIALMFTNADGKPCQPPCAFGIRPEETRIDDVVAVFQAHPLAHYWGVVSHKPGEKVSFSGGGSVVNVVAGRNGLVRFISVTYGTAFGRVPPDETPEALRATLGQVIAALGVPPRFQSIGRRDQGVAWSYYVERGLALQTRREGSEYINMDDPMIGLFVTTGLQGNLAFSAQQWLGFSNVEDYQAELARTAR